MSTHRPGARFRFLAPALLFAMLGMDPVLACSVRDLATPQDLVARADGIYHVRAARYFHVAAPRRITTPTWPLVPASRMGFDVVAVLKGPRRTRFQFPASRSEVDDFNPDGVPRRFVRPDGRRGSCFATRYRLYGEYLLFLRDGSPYWSPLAPTNEQVAGPGDPWIRWVSRQLRAGRKP